MKKWTLLNFIKSLRPYIARLENDLGMAVKLGRASPKSFHKPVRTGQPLVQPVQVELSFILNSWS